MRFFKIFFILFLSISALSTNPCLSLEPDIEEVSYTTKKRSHPVETEAEEVKYFLSHGSLTIPAEIGVYILSFLEPHEQLLACRVCQLWQRLVQTSVRLPAVRLTRFVQGDRSPPVMETVEESWQYFLNPRNFHFIYQDPLFFAKHHHSLVEFLKANPYAQEFLNSVGSENMTLDRFKEKIKIEEEHPQLQRELAALQLLRGLRADGDPEVGLSGVGLWDHDFYDPIAQKVEWCGYFQAPEIWSVQCNLFNNSLCMLGGGKNIRRIKKFFFLTLDKFSSECPAELNGYVYCLLNGLTNYYNRTNNLSVPFDIVRTYFQDDYRAYNMVLGFIPSPFGCNPVAQGRIDFEKLEVFLKGFLKLYELQDNLEQQTDNAEVQMNSRDLEFSLRILFQSFQERQNLESAENFLRRHALGSLIAWQEFFGVFNYWSVSERDVRVIESIHSLFQLQFPEKKKWHYALLHSLLQAYVQAGDEHSVMALLSKYEDDPVFHTKLFRSLLQIYGENNKDKLAEPFLRDRKDIILWQAYIGGLREALVAKLKILSRKVIERHIALYLEQFPERKFGKDHQTLVRGLVGNCVKEDRYNDISRILDTHLPGLYEMQFKNLLWAAHAFRETEEQQRPFMIERLEKMISKVDEGELKDRMRFRFIVKALKLPFSSEIYDKADWYLNELLARIEMQRITVLDELIYDETSDTSDVSFCDVLSDDENDWIPDFSSDEDIESEVQICLNVTSFEVNQEELGDWLVELYLYKVCIGLHNPEKKEEVKEYLKKLIEPSKTSSIRIKITPILFAIKQVGFESLDKTLQVLILELIESELWKLYKPEYGGFDDYFDYPDVLRSIFQDIKESDLKHFKSLSDLHDFIGEKPEEDRAKGS